MVAQRELAASKLTEAAASMRDSVSLLRAASADPESLKVEDPSARTAARKSIALGCYQVCEFFLVSGFAHELSEPAVSAFQLLEVVTSAGDSELPPYFRGVASRAAAFGYVLQQRSVGSRSEATDFEQIRSALQTPWEPGQVDSLDAACFLAEAVAWAWVGDADKARSALKRAVPLLEAAGQDVAKFRAVSEGTDLDLLRELTE
jgi:hypothetical protein